MRYLVISDIHANQHALDAVLADARRAGFDAVLCLGDLVGYGGDPTSVVETIRALAPVGLVRGNHDKVAAGLASADDFHEQARAAVHWTTRALSPEALAYLRALPTGPLTVADDIQICHGAPFDEDHYIFDARDAWRALQATSASLCVFGHTHVPAAFARAARSVEVVLADPDPRGAATQILPWRQDRAMLVNVGAVGQPRDGDPRAAYGIVDTEARAIELRRTDYDIKGAQTRIRAAGLPERLASRLDRGA